MGHSHMGYGGRIWLNLCIQETPKRVLLHTVKTQMFATRFGISSGSTLSVEVKKIFSQKINIFFKSGTKLGGD